MRKKKYTKHKFQYTRHKFHDSINLLWFLCFLFSSNISAQIFIGKNTIVKNLNEDIKDTASSDTLKSEEKSRGQIYIVKGTKVHNLKENTTAAIAYIPNTEKNTTKSLAKSSIQKKDKPQLQQKKIPATPVRYTYSKDSSDSYFAGNANELKVITNTNNFQFKYILNTQERVNVDAANHSKEKIIACRNKIDAQQKNGTFKVRPPPFEWV